MEAAASLLPRADAIARLQSEFGVAVPDDADEEAVQAALATLAGGRGPSDASAAFALLDADGSGNLSNAAICCHLTGPIVPLTNAST